MNHTMSPCMVRKFWKSNPKIRPGAEGVKEAAQQMWMQNEGVVYKDYSKDQYGDPFLRFLLASPSH